MSNTPYDQSIFNKSKKDKFVLTVNLPEELRQYNKPESTDNTFLDLNKLQFSIYGSVVPSENIPSQDIRYSGGNVYVSSHSRPSYEPVAVNFAIDNRFNNYWVIHKWLNLLRDEKDGYYGGEVSDKDKGLGKYTADFVLTAKDDYHNDIIEWIYKSAFPVSLGDINYSYRDADEIDCSFTFVFRRIETNLLMG
jgi:hypothetical protein